VLEVLDHLEHCLLHTLHDQLGDALPASDLEVLDGISVDQQHLEFSPITAVDETRGVEAGDSVAKRQSAARLDEARTPLGDRYRESGGHQRAAASGDEHSIVSGRKVEASVTNARIAGER
jgi:hypothetical protein